MKITFPSNDGIYETYLGPSGETAMRMGRNYAEAILGSDRIVIDARVSTADAVLQLVLLSDAIHNLTLAPQILNLPYLPYSRADKRRGWGDSCGLEVFGKILSQAHFEEIRSLDVHSRKAFTYIPGLVNIGPQRFIEAAIRRIGGAGTVLIMDEEFMPRYAGLSWPVVAMTLGSSERRGGGMPRLAVTLPPGPVLIASDVCVEGGNFTHARGYMAHDNVYMYASHGVFSDGFTDLRNAFKAIFTTNSIERGGGNTVVEFNAFGVAA